MSGGARNRLPTTYTPAYPATTESTATLPEVSYEPRYAPPPGTPPPFDKSLPAYSEEDKKDTESMKTGVAEDPFSDFEEHPRR